MDKIAANNRITAETEPDKLAAKVVAERRVVSPGRAHHKRLEVKVETNVSVDEEAVTAEMPAPKTTEMNAPKKALDL